MSIKLMPDIIRETNVKNIRRQLITRDVGILFKLKN